MLLITNTKYTATNICVDTFRWTIASSSELSLLPSPPHLRSIMTQKHCMDAKPIESLGSIFFVLFYHSGARALWLDQNRTGEMSDTGYAIEKALNDFCEICKKWNFTEKRKMSMNNPFEHRTEMFTLITFFTSHRYVVDWLFLDCYHIWSYFKIEEQKKKQLKKANVRLFFFYDHKI